MRIESLIAETLNNMAPQINDKGHKTSMEFEPDIPPVLADKEHMERVFCNLITNAVKFTPYGGQISFAVKKSGHFVEVRLTDSGVGIPRMNCRCSSTSTIRAKAQTNPGGAGLDYLSPKP